jgi:hypothetical protein
MAKQLVQNWYNKLPSAERDLPLILLNGIVYTPTAAYNEVMRGSPVGNQLQTLIETGKFGTSPTDAQTIAKTRLQQWLQSQPQKPLFATLSNKVYTPSQLLEEIQAGSSIGNQWVNNEISHMTSIMQIR